MFHILWLSLFEQRVKLSVIFHLNTIWILFLFDFDLTDSCFGQFQLWKNSNSRERGCTVCGYHRLYNLQPCSFIQKKPTKPPHWKKPTQQLKARSPLSHKAGNQMGVGRAAETIIWCTETSVWVKVQFWLCYTAWRLHAVSMMLKSIPLWA